MQKCQKSAVPQQLTETKQMPVCVPVTKQQCDSKWEVQVNAETGEMEKVWAGNENCREVTWEDCSLETREVTQQVGLATKFQRRCLVLSLLRRPSPSLLLKVPIRILTLLQMDD